jgi:hypothetical protein
MTEERGIGAWDPATDPDPVPGQPPRNVTPIQRPPEDAARTTRKRDPNAPPEGTETVKSFGGEPPPIRNFPKRCMWITLPAPYDGWHIHAWVNAPDKLLNDLQKRIGNIRSPDDPRIDPDDPALAIDDYSLDPEEYGISAAERQARVNEVNRRLRERERRTAEKEKRQVAYDAAMGELNRYKGEIVMEHDIPDMDGVLLPPDSQEFWDFTEGELQTVILTAIAAQRGKLTPTNARRS